MRRLRLHAWLCLADAIVLCGGYRSRLYWWAIGRAARLEDWGPSL